MCVSVLHIIFFKITKNYNTAFEFVKVVIQNIVNPDSENGIFDDVTITSALRNDMLIYGESFPIFE